jgi:bacterioferritin-associated ferredoxin
VSDGLPTLMRAQMSAEFELIHNAKPVTNVGSGAYVANQINGVPSADLVIGLVNALKGIASCGTDCGCCQLHKEIAEEALARWRLDEVLRETR